MELLENYDKNKIYRKSLFVIFIIVTAIILMPLPADAAQPKQSGTPNSAESTDPGSPFTITHTVTPGTNNIMIVNIGIRDINTTPISQVVSVKWASDSSCESDVQLFTKNIEAEVSQIRAESWYLEDPEARAGTICIVTNNATWERMAAAVVTYDFVNQENPFDDYVITTSDDDGFNKQLLQGTVDTIYGDSLFVNTFWETGGQTREVCESNACPRLLDILYTQRTTGNDSIGLEGTLYESQTGTTTVQQETTPDGPWIMFLLPLSQDESPEAPILTAAVLEDTTISLSWSEPFSGGSPITDYIIQSSTDGTNWVTVDDGTNTIRSYLVSGLTPGQTYHFRVAAFNTLQGPFSDPVTATTTDVSTTLPTAPLAIFANPGDGEVYLSWNAPADDGGSEITDYVIEYSTDATNWVTVDDGTSTTIFTTVTGLENGQLYYFRVAAVNTNGQGPYASISSTPLNFPTPSEVQNLAATPGDGEVYLSWNAPADDGGSEITDYVIEYSTDETTWTTFNDGTSTTIFTTVTGLENGQLYYFRVTAVNTNGQGDDARTSATPAISPTSPAKVTGLGAVPISTSSIELSWDIPSNGGSPITGYKIERKIGTGSWSPLVENTANTETSYIDDELDPYTAYYYRVSAINEIGTGPSSEPVSVIFIPDNTIFRTGQTFDSSLVFGKFVKFLATQTWLAPQTFGDHTFFAEGPQDFSGYVMTFNDGTIFNDDAFFKDGQELPANTVMPYGLLLKLVDCTGENLDPENKCKPDASEYIEPGEFIPPGIDPDELLVRVANDDTTFQIKGLGIRVSFEEVTTDGTLLIDPYDPELLPSSTEGKKPGSRLIVSDGEGYQTAGSVFEITLGTGENSGEIYVTVPYSEDSLPEGLDESELVLLHFTRGSWEVVPDSTVDTVANTISGTVTSFSSFGAGGKSGSSGAGAGAGGDKNCDSSAFSSGESLRVYEISYDICDTEIVQVVAESFCGPVNLSILYPGGMSRGGMSNNQPFLDEHRLVLNAPISQDYDKFRVLVENNKHYYDRLIIPQKVSGVITQCQDTMIISHDTGYLSKQEGAEVSPQASVGPRKIISEDETPVENLVYESQMTDSAIEAVYNYDTPKDYVMDPEPGVYYVVMDPEPGVDYAVVDPEPGVDYAVVDPEPCSDAWNGSCMVARDNSDNGLHLLSWIFDLFNPQAYYILE